MKIAVIIFTIFILHYDVHAQTQCTTPKNTAGSCISIRECKELSTIFRKTKQTPEDLTLLRDSTCGLEIDGTLKVCCGKDTGNDEDWPSRRCITPYGNEGTCKAVQSCPILQNLFESNTKQNKILVENHRCQDISVCCTTCQPSFAPPNPLSGCCGLDKSNSKPLEYVSPNITIYQYPWMAIIEHENLINHKMFRHCVGALISSKYVLTARSCVYSYRSSTSIPRNVLLGEYDLSHDGRDCVEVDTGEGQICTDDAITVPIEEIINHLFVYLESTRNRATHDIALLRLQYSVLFTDFIRPLCLPTSDLPKDDSITIYAAGWGKTEDSISSNVKIHVDLPYVTREECRKHYSMLVWNGYMCAGGVEGRDTCYGDAGGPLMYYNGYYFEIVGIVTFEPRRCGTSSPKVYTKVFDYVAWIRSQMKP